MLSSTLKAAKADLRKRLTFSKDKPLTRLNELEPLVSSSGTMSTKSIQRSLLNVIFDTKSGRKLHKRTRSDPTPESDSISEAPELELALQPSRDARVFSVGTNQALDAVFDATTSSGEYCTCPSDSYDSFVDMDDWSISDHGTVLIRRPPGLHPARSPSVNTLSTRNTLYEEPVTPEVEAEYNPEIGITSCDELNAESEVPQAEVTETDNAFVDYVLISSDTANDNSPSDTVQESSSDTNNDLGNSDNNIRTGFSQPFSMNQLNRVVSKIIKGQTKKNLILRPIKELRRNRQTFSGPSTTTRKAQNSVRRLFYAGNKAITAAPIVDNRDNTTPATESTPQSHENEQNLTDTPMVDDDQSHQLSTHESIDNGDDESTHDVASECNMVGTLHHGDNGELEFRQPRTNVTDDITSAKDMDHVKAHHDPEHYDFSDERRALEKWAHVSSHWGDPSIGPDAIRKGFEDHLAALKSLHGSDFFKIATGYQSPTFVNRWLQGNLKRHMGQISFESPHQPTLTPRQSHDMGNDDDKSLDFNQAKALHHPQARHIAGYPANEAKDKYYDLANFLTTSTKREEILDRDVQQTRERIDARSAQLERCIALVRQLEAQGNAEAAQRRKGIYRQVSQLLKVTGAQGSEVKSRCDAKSELYRDLLHREKALVDAVQDEAGAIGLGNHTPNELEWALQQMVAGDSLEYVEDALNSCF
ncbi:hypothetical protein CEP54_006501 [Fusarium duplospermum]|uniref:Uncharacterized protein n=1 Tax=Fusarium duplospermum TaxID=1325734 RepID=A0A428Q6I6_9HYPO|nr:hypothetical protein CEP54_006501 [Fusarium duplospermum]